MSTPYSGGASGAPPLGEPNFTQGGASSYAPPPAGQAYGDAQPMTDDGHPDVEGTSVGSLIGEVTRDMSTLMRQELAFLSHLVRLVGQREADGAVAGRAVDAARHHQPAEPEAPVGDHLVRRDVRRRHEERDAVRERRHDQRGGAAEQH